MAKARSWFLGGCLAVIAGMVFMFFMGRFLMAPHVPGRAILSLRFDGPIAEITSEDPFAEILGEQPLSLRDLRRALVAAADDDRIVGVRVRMDSFGGGFATAQEVRGLLRSVSRAGKWTAAYMDTAGEFTPGNMVYYVASACDEVSMNSMGDLNLIGLSVRSPFIRGTLDRLEIRPEFPGRGAYKTARYLYTERDFTPEHREMMEWLVDSLMGQITRDIAAARDTTPEMVREIIDRAPLLGSGAVDAGLVDKLEDWTEFNNRLKEKDDAGFVGLKPYLQGLRRPSLGQKIAVVTATGAIMRGKNGRNLNPLLGGEIMGSETISTAWRKVRETRGIKAVVFRIDSPGGSAVASEIIRREMARTAEDLPVVVSMSNLAASGGYWITCGARKIVAEPGTLTASIGVFGGHLNMDGFWRNKLGVTFGRLDAGKNANIYGGLEDWNDGQRAIVDRMLDRIYDEFLDRVAASRGMTREQVDAMARGRVFTGEQALEKGLVDALGGLDVAIAQAKELAGISPETAVTLVDFPKPEPWWKRMIEKGREVRAGTSAVEELRQWWETGVLQPPGVVWMPPVYIR